MPGPFDTTTKYLVQTYPRDWLGRFGLASSARLELLDADLATVNPLADKIIRVDEPAPWLAHLEFQSTYDAAMGSVWQSTICCCMDDTGCRPEACWCCSVPARMGRR